MKFPLDYFEKLLLQVSYEKEWINTVNFIIFNFNTMDWLNMITFVNSRHSIDHSLIFDKYYHELHQHYSYEEQKTQSKSHEHHKHSNKCKFCTKKFLHSDGVLKHVKKTHFDKMHGVVKGKKSTYMIISNHDN